jgi:hypothetical protein
MDRITPHLDAVSMCRRCYMVTGAGGERGDEGFYSREACGGIKLRARRPGWSGYLQVRALLNMRFERCSSDVAGRLAAAEKATLGKSLGCSPQYPQTRTSNGHAAYYPQVAVHIRRLANPSKPSIPEPSRSRLEGSGAVVEGGVVTIAGATQVELKQVPAGSDMEPLFKLNDMSVSTSKSATPLAPPEIVRVWGVELREKAPAQGPDERGGPPKGLTVAVPLGAVNWLCALTLVPIPLQLPDTDVDTGVDTAVPAASGFASWNI